MARLLIVDDEESIGDALQQVFEYEGHQVRVARDGPEGLESAKAFLPDVTFLDVKMPGMDGHEALHKIKKIDPKVQVIMLTGHGSVDSAKTSLKGEAFDYLNKLRRDVEEEVTSGRGDNRELGFRGH